MNTTAPGLLNNRKIWFFILILFTLSSCAKQNDGINPKNVKKIKVAYLPKWINPHHAIDECEYVFGYEIFKDTTIIDREFINKFIASVNQLETSNELLNYDFRIYCIIQFNDDTPYIKLCLGPDRLTVLDGQLMKDTINLFNMLDEVLYSN